MQMPRRRFHLPVLLGRCVRRENEFGQKSLVDVDIRVGLITIKSAAAPTVVRVLPDQDITRKLYSRLNFRIIPIIWRRTPMMQPSCNPSSAAYYALVGAVCNGLPCCCVTPRCVRARQNLDISVSNIGAVRSESVGPSGKIWRGQTWRAFDIEKHQELAALRGKILLPER